MIDDFTANFLSDGPESIVSLRAMVDLIIDDLAVFAQRREVTVPADGLALRRALEADGPILPDHGEGFTTAWSGLGRRVLDGAVNVSSPRYAAHYLAVPTLASIAVEVAVGALNQSLDSFDQGPSATVLETMIIDMLASAAGMADGDGVFVAGASMSNLMALLIARDSTARGTAGESVPRLRVIASELSHFSIAQAAGIIGLPPEAVISIPVDANGAMDPALLATAIDEHGALPGPLCVVVTLGTTDSGAFDPLEVALRHGSRHQAWIHVDAAASGALLLSNRHRHLVTGIELADSVGLDFHKLGWQTVPSGCFLVSHRDSLEAIRHHSDYLNPSSEPDLLNLAWKSVQTTRRFDALKLALTLRTLGRDGIDELLDAQFAAISHAVERISAEPQLELGASGLHTVLFRYIPPHAMTADDVGDQHNPEQDLDQHNIDEHNEQLRSALASTGVAMLGRSRFNGSFWLKIQELNPLTTPRDIDNILESVLATASTFPDLTPGERGTCV